MGHIPVLDTVFKDANNPYELLRTEELMRQNACFVRTYCRQRLQENCLNLAAEVYDYYLTLRDGKLRKDNITPSEQHEQSHLLNLIGLLDADQWNLGYDQHKFGGAEALFMATIFHDVIEDDDHSAEQLLKVMQDRIPALRTKYKLTPQRELQLQAEAMHATNIVKLISRNEPDENGNIPSRSAYNTRWLKHPGAVIIKMIDWNNKISTMPGVKAFEEKGQWRMRRNIDETDHVFLDSAQKMALRAAETYPEIEGKLKRLDSVMAILFRSVKGYLYYSSSDATPKDECPFSFDEWIEPAQAILENVPDGANDIKRLERRIAAIGEDKPNIAEYHRYILAPALKPLLEPQERLNPPYTPPCACRPFPSPFQ